MSAIKLRIKGILYSFGAYLKRNPGAIFVILFMITLAAAAGFLMVKKEQVAVHIGNLAYLFLVIGAIIYIIQLYREKKNDNEKKESVN